MQSLLPKLCRNYVQCAKLGKLVEKIPKRLNFDCVNPDKNFVADLIDLPKKTGSKYAVSILSYRASLPSVRRNSCRSWQQISRGTFDEFIHRNSVLFD